MNFFENALNSDIKKDYLKAIQFYEEVITDTNAPVESFINLSFIYWEFAAEFSFRNFYNIPENWGKIGGERYSLVLKKGLLSYPFHLELHFWSKYFRHRLYFDNFSPEDCSELINKFGESDSIVPYFYLYLFDKGKFKDKINALIISCDKTPTAKNIYIKSLIE